MPSMMKAKVRLETATPRCLTHKLAAVPGTGGSPVVEDAARQCGWRFLGAIIGRDLCGFGSRQSRLKDRRFRLTRFCWLDPLLVGARLAGLCVCMATLVVPLVCVNELFGSLGLSRSFGSGPRRFWRSLVSVVLFEEHLRSSREIVGRRRSGKTGQILDESVRLCPPQVRLVCLACENKSASP